MTRKRRRRHTPRQIVKKLRDADAMLNAGKDLSAVLQSLEVNEATYHGWRNQYRGMKSEEAKRLRQLEGENKRLTELDAEKELDIRITMRTRLQFFTPETRHVAFLFNALLLVIMVEDLCDFSGIRKREILGTQPFEYPVLASALYSLGTSLWASPMGISVFIGAVSIVFAVAVTALLKREDADVAAWQGAPSLLMVAVNIDAVVAFLILSATIAWQRARTIPAGIWIGLGIALKVIPAFVVLPLCAASSWRRVSLLVATVATTWMVCNAPLMLTDPDAWWFPYAFASQRSDTWGTFWKYVPLSPKGINLASLGLVLVSQVIVSMAVWSRKIRPVAGVAVALLAFMLVNKVWMPQYILWVLPLLALLKLPRLPVLSLELTTLIFWAAFWFAIPEPWFLPVMLLRSASAVWVITTILRSEQIAGADAHNLAPTSSVRSIAG